MEKCKKWLKEISIHAPVKGATGTGMVWDFLGMIFQSTHP